MKVIHRKSQRWLSIFLVFILFFASVPTSAGATKDIDANEINQFEVENQVELKNEEEVNVEADQSNEDIKEEKEDNSDEEKDKGLESTKDNNSKKSEEKNKEESNDNNLSNEDKVKVKKEAIEENDSKDEAEKEEDLEDRSAEIKEKVEISVQHATEYYKDNPPNYKSYKGSHSDYWTYAALWGAGLKNLRNDIPWESEESAPWARHTYWSQGKDSKVTNSNEAAGIIIGSILLEKNPYRFGNSNVVDDLIAKQNKENGNFSTLWGDPWAMIALDLMDAKYDKEKLINFLLSKQSTTGMFGDADATGWILTALAPYYNERQDVKNAINATVEYIHEYYQNNNDVPGQMFAANSNSTASIIMGLAANGENLYSTKWTTEEGNIVEQFIDNYQQKNGSFWWQKEQAGAIAMSTDQSVLALSTVIQGESIFVQLKGHSQGLKKNTTVSVRVEGINETSYPEQDVQVETFADKPTALEATKQALNDASIPFEDRHGYISSIKGDEEASFDGWDGWQYMVNDVYPDVYADDYEIKEGDKIVWFYGNVGDIYQGVDVADEIEKLTLIPAITISSEIYEDEEIEVEVTSTYNVYAEDYSLVKENERTTIKDAIVHFNGKTYATDENGIAKIPAEDVKIGEYELQVTKDIENSYPRLLRQSKKIIVKEKPDPKIDIDGFTDGEIVNHSTINFSVSARDYKNNDIDPVVTLNEQKVTPDKNGTFTVDLNKGENIVEIIARDGTREVKKVFKITFDQQEEQQNQFMVTQSIVISGKEIPLPATELEVYEEDNVIDVLKRAAKEHNIPIEVKDLGWGEYVASIANVAEFDRGEQSGWMFRVNGKFSDVGASDVYIIPGDKIEWLYTLDYGKDIGATEFEPIREQMEPIIEIDHLPSDSLVRDSKHTIRIRANSYFGTPLIPVVKLNGKTVERQSVSKLSQTDVSNGESDEPFVYQLEFIEGTNSIEIEATDAGKRKTVERYEYTYIPQDKEIEKTNPRLNIEGVKNNSIVYTPSLRLTVSAEDYMFNPLRPLIELNGKQIEQKKDGQYEIELKKGANKIVIRAIDEDGRETTKSFLVTYMANDEDKAYKEHVEKAIKEVSKHILSNGITTEWQAIGLDRAGYADQPQFKAYHGIFEQNLQEQVIDKLGTGRLLITDVERLAIASFAVGKDPTNINGLNLIEKIYNSEDARDGSNSLTFQGNNGILFALIALDTKNFDIPKNATWTREKLIEELLQNQRDDGAWSLTATSSKQENASFDITAMALTALAPYNNSDYPEVQEAIRRAVDFLSTSQDESGGFSDDFVGGVSSETTAQVIIGLTANGIDPRSDQFTKQDINLLDHLLKFQAKDGGFTHLLGDENSNPMASEQGLQALVAYKMFVNNEGRLYDFSIEPEKKEEIDPGIKQPENQGPDGQESNGDETTTGKEKGELENAQTDIDNQNSQMNQQKAGEESKALPKTATTMFNIILIGTILILLGIGIYMIRRKQNIDRS
ncbi:DUF4430 domain-containing protein [Pseudogracilibacillus sp. SE30717A]|uniref:DUF4430 domain-containing protein n=1 Tax=Pseudogracilibacillus sp. SE30717A TaxID=3098293 RepID=UPI00300E582E